MLSFNGLSEKRFCLSGAGHEIAIHGVRHPHLEMLSLMEMYWHITEDCRRLSELAGYYVNDLA